MDHFDDLQVEEFSMQDFVEDCWDEMHEKDDDITWKAFLNSNWDF